MGCDPDEQLQAEQTLAAKDTKYTDDKRYQYASCSKDNICN